MLSKSGCLILPFYKQNGDLLKPNAINSLNAFATIWCCVENILLAATAEGVAAAFRIPLGSEPKHIADVVNHPDNYIMPCYISVGYPAPDAVVLPQIERNVEDKIRINIW